MLEPETVMFILASVSSIIILIFLKKFIALRNQNENTRSTIESVSVIVLSMLFLNIGIMIGQFDDLYRFIDPTIDFNEYMIYSISYAIYFSFWIFGNNRLLTYILRIPRIRKIHFNYVKYILYFEIILSIMLIITIFITSRFTNPSNFDNLYEITFVIISQIALLNFIYFYRMLNNESQISKSLLIKARINQIKNSVMTQILISITVTIGALLLFLDLDALPSAEIQVVIFGVIGLLSVICCYFQYTAIILPLKVRTRFNLAPTRFKEIQGLFLHNDSKKI